MKTSLMSAAALAGFCSPARPTPDRHRPAVVRPGDAGATYQDEINSTPKVKGKSGWTVDAAVGRQIDSHFRAEGQLIYSDDKTKVGDGRIKMSAGLANGYYDFDTGTKLKPFVGAGVGIGQVKLDGGPSTTTTPASPTSC
jgi:opacity protein-like surface antigen